MDNSRGNKLRTHSERHYSKDDEKLHLLGSTFKIRSDQQDKVMMQLMRTWLYKYDHSAMLCAKIEPMIKRLVGVVRRLLDEFCTTYTPDDLFVVVFFYADRFIERVGFVDKNHLTGVLISSVICTIKFHEDKGLYNSWVAAACNLSRRDTHHMERVFLSTLKYELMITSSQLNKFFSTHNKAWEDRCALYVPSSPSPKSSPKSKSSRSRSPSPSPKHSSSRTVSSSSKRTSSSSSKRQPLQPVQPKASSSSKLVSSSSSSSKHASKHPTTSNKSSKPTQSSSSTTLPTKPTTAKISKVTKAYKVLTMFKICVHI